MHNAAFAIRQNNAVYVPFHVRDLPDFIAAIEPFRIAGFSVTIPHKERILRYLHDCDRLAAEIGAVNTVAVRAGKLYGYNTDFAGVLRAIERRLALSSSSVLLLGAGGAARAAAFALARAGSAVTICARRPQRARALARAVGGEMIDRRKIARRSFDAIVNCTPVGMHPGGGSPLESRELNCRLVMDLIYRPLKTELLRRAERRGIETISGVDMFVAQGAAQWKLWMGQRAPERAMRRAVLAALQKEEEALRR
jgi:3-dehydroquinate dehydratase/shikimate dehydrogenase